MYTNKMISKLKKEQILYESLINKASDKDFMISFHDYFSFIEKEGIGLCSHLNEPIKERNKDEDTLKNLYIEILSSVTKFIKDIELFLKKEGLEKEFLFEDRLRDAKSYLNSAIRVMSVSMLDSIHSEMVDVTRELKKLGFEKELEKYVNKDRHARLNTEDIIAFEKRKQLSSDINIFHKKDARSLAGVFVRLLTLYAEINKMEGVGEIKINIDTFLSDLGERNKNTEYMKLISGELTNGKYFKKENYLSDVERFHQSIVMNNAEEEISDKKEILYLEGDDIYHYKKGKLKQTKRGAKEYKYIIMLKNIIRYMPTKTSEISIKNFEKNVPKDRSVGTEYRSNLISKGSFDKFLADNNLKNSHPDTEEKILHITDTYIYFNNNL